MKALMFSLLLGLATPSLAGDVVFCFKDSAGLQTFLKADVEGPVNADSVQQDLARIGASAETMDQVTLVVDMDSQKVVLDKRPNSKLHKTVPRKKMDYFSGLVQSDMNEVNEFADLVGPEQDS